jgi:hypothetical protein
MQSGGREALIVAHPGHEVRIHGWLSGARPLTFVLTDGSGMTGTSRVASTGEILRDAGIPAGAVFSPLTDAEAYAAILGGDTALFRRLAETIAAELVEHEVTSVTADGWEGYNPSHDVCRLIADAAVVIASRQLGRTVENWAFPLTGRPDEPRSPAETRRLELDDDAFERKMAHAERYREIGPDVAAGLAEFGREAFRHEVFTRVTVPHWHDRRFLDMPPFYETHGERRVGEGKYGAVIRYREHILPIAAELQSLACASS